VQELEENSQAKLNKAKEEKKGKGRKEWYSKRIGWDNFWESP